MKKSLKNNIPQVVLSIARWVFLISVGYIAIFPLIAMISTSFMTFEDLVDQSVVYLPKTPTIAAFKEAFSKLNYPHAFWMTLTVPIIGGLIEVVTCAVTAYGFARFDFKEKNLLFGIVILTIAVPSTLLMIPQYVQFYNFDPLKLLALINKIFGKNLELNLLDTGFTFWLPSLFSVGLRSGVFIFIYRQFFKGLPKEFEEAAYVDGANPVMAFIKVIIPSSRVAITTVLVFSIVWHWNEYYTTGIFLLRDNRVLSVMLNAINDYPDYTPPLRMAAALMIVLPVLIVYLFLQKQFIKSIDKVGIVG